MTDLNADFLLVDPVSSIQLLACDISVANRTIQLDTSVYPIGVHSEVLYPNEIGRAHV